MTNKANLLLAILLLIYSYSKSQIKRDTTLESVLDLTIEQLMNTKVSIATKSEKKLSETPAIVSVLTSEIIKNSGARNLADILQSVPGFEFSKSRSGFVNIGVRGVKDPLTTSRFLVLKDGIPYNDIMYGLGIATTKGFDINTIKRIEVIRGPGSALYGRNAFIGVINIITKSGEDKNNIDVNTSIGNFGTYSLGASYGTKKDDFGAYFAIEKVKSDVTNSELDDGMGRLGIWNLDIDNLFINTKIDYKNFVFTGMYSDIINGASIGPFATDSDKSSKIGMYSLEYQNKIIENLNLGIRIYGRNESQVQNLEIFSPGITAEAAPGLTFGELYPNGMYATPSFESYTYGSDLNLSTVFFKKHNALFGIQADIYGLNSVELKSSYDTYTGNPHTYTQDNIVIFRGKDTQIKEERGWIEGNGHSYYNIAFYLQNIYQATEKLSLTIGGRYDIDSEFGEVFNPRLALVLNTNGRIILKALYGQAYRAPNSQEQYRKTGFTIGNKDLKPETIKTTEFSVDYNSSKKNINTRITFFHNIINDMIYAQGITSGTPGGMYSNIGKNRSIGFEYEYKMTMLKQFYMFFNYSFTLSEDEVNAKGATEVYTHRDVAPHKINVGLNYKFLNHFNLNTTIHYRSSREKYFAVDKRTGDYILDTDGNKVFVSNDKIGDYFLINAKLRIFNLLKFLSISAEIFNVLGTEYFDQDAEFSYQPKREGRQYIFRLNLNF